MTGSVGPRAQSEQPEGIGHNLISMVGDVAIMPVDLARKAIDLLPQLFDANQERKNRLPDHEFSIKDTVLEFFHRLKQFHLRVLSDGAKSSEYVEKSLYKGTKFVLTPLRCIPFFGQSLRLKAAEGISKIARVITFVASQILHALPYLFASAVVSGAALLLQAAPVVMFAILGTLAVSTLLILTQKIVANLNVTQQQINSINNGWVKIIENKNVEWRESLEGAGESAKPVRKQIDNAVEEIHQQIDSVLEVTSDKIDAVLETTSGQIDEIRQGIYWKALPAICGTIFLGSVVHAVATHALRAYSV